MYLILIDCVCFIFLTDLSDEEDLQPEFPLIPGTISDSLTLLFCLLFNISDRE